MTKFEIVIIIRNEAHRVEIVSAPDIVKAFEYGLNKYGSHRVYTNRYFGKEEPTTTL